MKIKELRDALASIGIIVEDEDLVCCTLNGLREDERWKPFITSMNLKDEYPKFDQLIPHLVTEELNFGAFKGKDSYNQVLYAGQGKGRILRGGSRGGSREKGRGCNKFNYNQINLEENKDGSNDNTQGRG